MRWQEAVSVSDCGMAYRKGREENVLFIRYADGRDEKVVGGFRMPVDPGQTEGYPDWAPLVLGAQRRIELAIRESPPKIESVVERSKVRVVRIRRE